MKIPKWRISDLRNKLMEEFKSLSLTMSCDDPREWAWNKDTYTHFSVRAEDTIYWVEIYEDGILKHQYETDDPEKVIQDAKEFIKSL